LYRSAQHRYERPTHLKFGLAVFVKTKSLGLAVGLVFTANWKPIEPFLS